MFHLFKFQGVAEQYTLVSSFTGQDQQQELVSVLRLITHACKKLPGVFGHGNGNSILPVIGRLIPLFASPIFRYCYHDSKYKTIAFQSRCHEKSILEFMKGHFTLGLHTRSLRFSSAGILNRGKGTSLLDAFSALLSLLQSADITTYIQVINDTVHLVEGV